MLLIFFTPQYSTVDYFFIQYRVRNYFWKLSLETRVGTYALQLFLDYNSHLASIANGEGW